MFQDTRPAELGEDGGPDAWAQFRVAHAGERISLLRQLRDGSTPLMLNTPEGGALAAAVWVVDSEQQRLNLNTNAAPAQTARLVDANEAVAVAYLESVKLQFELSGFVLVRSAVSASLQCAMPREIYRFQRRGAYRVRTVARHDPVARFRHPGMPEMGLTLRLLDVSIGGCALWLPASVPPLQAGTRLGELRVELDSDNRFAAPAVLQHVSSTGQDGRGMRLGCEWAQLPGAAERVLQRWIDRAQQRHRMLSTS